MAQTTPKVQLNQLYLNGGRDPVCQVGSPDWFAWLETANSFRYYTTRQTEVARGHTRAMFPIIIRKEKRRQGYLWYAYRRAHGLLHKRYVGKTAVLSRLHLDEVAACLDAVW